MMQKRYMAFLVLCLLLTLQVRGGGEWEITGQLEPEESGWLYLAACHFGHYRVVDSLYSDDGRFLFSLDEDAPAGMYSLLFPFSQSSPTVHNRAVTFLFNRESFSLYIRTGPEGALAVTGGSLENEVYRLYLDHEEQYMKQIGMLYPMLGGAGEPARRAGRQYEALQHARSHFIDSLAALYPGLLSTRLIQAGRSPFLSAGMSHRERIDTLRHCFFDQAALDDPGLLHTAVYPTKIQDYLGLYRGTAADSQAEEEGFIEAVDHLMTNVSADPRLYAAVSSYLLELFERTGMEAVQLYLADQYLEEQCRSDVAALVQERMEGYRKMSVGQPAPDVVVRDIGGVNHRLSEMDHDFVLLVFWASSCEHCVEILPEMARWYEEERKVDLEVVAVSIDSSARAMQHWLEGQPLPWIVSHDPLGWRGHVPAAYHIYATPAMFLIDRKGRIVARPRHLRHVQKALKRLS